MLVISMTLLWGKNESSLPALNDIIFMNTHKLHQILLLCYKLHLNLHALTMPLAFYASRNELNSK